MWLFDDLIKKPANTDTSWSSGSGNGFGWSNPAGGTSSWGTSWSSGSGGAIFIEKTSEQTIFGPNTESQNIDKENAVSPEPTVHAEADASPILMSSSEMINTTNNFSESVTPAWESQVISTNNGYINNTTTPLDITLEWSSTFDIQTIWVQNSIPNNGISINTTQSPLQNLTSTGQSSQGTLPDQNPASSNLFGNILEKTEESQVTPNLVDPMSADLASETAPNAAEIMGNTPVVDVGHDFSTPREFIEKNLVSIDTMMANIDKRHEAKIREAEGYKAEKLRFTELEKSAYSEASIMDRERDHALHMKKILEAELERDTANRNPKSEEPKHVESSLSEIGTEHAISHRHSHKKHESAPEEDIFAAS